MEKINLYTILIVGLILVGVLDAESGEARIVGGSTVKPNEWAAQVYITRDAVGARNCSGTLIDFKTVLTNGACMNIFMLSCYIDYFKIELKKKRSSI